jgi:hypothetical protein
MRFTLPTKAKLCIALRHKQAGVHAASRRAITKHLASFDRVRLRNLTLHRTVYLEDRADHLNKVLNGLSAYLTAILHDTAQNVPGGLDLRQVNALLSDLASDVSGTLQQAVERMAWRLA